MRTLFDKPCEAAKDHLEKFERLYDRAVEHAKANHFRERDATALLATRSLVKAVNAQIEHDAKELLG